MCDVLVMTAMYDEFAALEAAPIEGGIAGWRTEPDEFGLVLKVRDFRTVAGGTLRIAASWAAEQGAAHTAARASRLVQKLKPRCLAMTGICAGWKDRVKLGDVILARQFFTYDSGKEVTDRSDRWFYPDNDTVSLCSPWANVALPFVNNWNPPSALIRPKDFEQQMLWLLEYLLTKPLSEDPAINQNCTERGRVLKMLWEKGLVQDQFDRVTEAGLDHLRNAKMHGGDGAAADITKAHYGAIASGRNVVVNDEVFKGLAEMNRAVHGLEREATGLAAVYREFDLKRVILVKGVQDFASLDKCDLYRSYAAQAAATFLVDFLRHYPPTDQDGAAGIGPDVRPLPKPTCYVERPQSQTKALDSLLSGAAVVVYGPWKSGKSKFTDRLRSLFQQSVKTAVPIDLSADWINGGDNTSLEMRLFEKFLQDIRAVVPEVGAAVEHCDVRGVDARSRMVNLLSILVKKAPGVQPLLIIDRPDRLVGRPQGEGFLSHLRAINGGSGHGFHVPMILMVSLPPTELNLRIADIKDSPFNIAEQITIGDFSEEQVADLARQHGVDINVKGMIDKWSGHPYLASLAIKYMKNNHMSFRSLMDCDPFLVFEHFARHINRIFHNHPDVREHWLKALMTPLDGYDANYDPLVELGLLKEEISGSKTILSPRHSIFETLSGRS